MVAVKPVYILYSVRARWRLIVIPRAEEPTNCASAAARFVEVKNYLLRRCTRDIAQWHSGVCNQIRLREAGSGR